RATWPVPPVMRIFFPLSRGIPYRLSVLAQGPFQLRTQDSLELADVLRGHEGVVRAWDLDVAVALAGEAVPFPELGVQPFFFRSAQRDRVEHADGLDLAERLIGPPGLDQGLGKVNPGAESRRVEVEIAKAVCGGDRHDCTDLFFPAKTPYPGR